VKNQKIKVSFSQNGPKLQHECNQQAQDMCSVFELIDSFFVAKQKLGGITARPQYVLFCVNHWHPEHPSIHLHFILKRSVLTNW